MEEMIQKFINEHKNGVMISEMEATLRQSKLRLGYVTKKLLNEGKVLKIDNRYYPVLSTLKEKETPNS